VTEETVTEETTTSAVASVPSADAPASPCSPGGPTGTGVSAAAGATAAAGPLITPRPTEIGADQVTVRMPADGAYLSVLRTATAGLAARLDFTLDDIEDLRIAVDEACAMLLSQAIPGSSLECSFTLSADDLTISVAVPSLSPRPPSGDTFAWTVLSALAGTVEAQVGPGDRLAIVMRKSRPNSGLV
jgi:serine/threonine-protein kinase RsbW